eukprot:gene24049-32463_t
MDVNNLRRQVTTQQRLRDESRNWAVISFVVTAIVWSFTSDLAWRASVTVVAAILFADYIFFRSVDNSSPSLVQTRNSAALTFGARKPQSFTTSDDSIIASVNDDPNPPKTFASINSSTKPPISQSISDNIGRNEILSHSSMEASWKEIEFLQQQQQQQQQQDPTQQYFHQQYPSSQRAFSLDPSFTSFLSPSPATHRGHPISASRVATPSAMNASYNSNISGGAYPMAYSSPFATRGPLSATTPGTAGGPIPEWQEYRISPSVSFRGDRPVYASPYHRHPNLTSAGGPMEHLTVQRPPSHDNLRSVSVQDALGIERDVPDEWVEALKDFDESSRVILESLRTVIKPAAGTAAPTYPVNTANTISQGDFNQAAALEILLDYEYSRSLFFLSDMIYAPRSDDAVKLQKRLRDMAAKSSRLRFVIARKAALLRGNFNSVFHAASSHNATTVPSCYVTIRSDIEHSLGNSQQTPTGKSSESLSQRFLIFRDFSSSSVPSYNSPEHKFVVLHLVEAQAVNLTQRKVRQAEVVEVEEGKDVDHMSNKYLDDGGRLSSRVAREMLKDIFGTKEVNQCINDTLGLNL